MSKSGKRWWMAVVLIGCCALAALYAVNKTPGEVADTMDKQQETPMDTTKQETPTDSAEPNTASDAPEPEPLFDVSVDVPESDEFVLPGLIADHMVLQRETELTIWGGCAQDGPVAVQINGQVDFGHCQDGRFSVRVRPLAAGGPYDLVIRSQTGKKTIADVLVGDVYVASGQSNMQMTMYDTDYEEKNNYENDRLRFYVVTPHASMDPIDETDDLWLRATSKTVPMISAVGFYFGKTIQEKTDVPIGIVVAAQGDTILSTWAPKEEAEEMPRVYQEFTSVNRIPSTYYNGMIHPLTSYRFKGVVWYQGENQPHRYDQLLEQLIRGWRRAFNDEQLTFVIVQLPRWGAGDDESWHVTREHQKAAALRVPRATYSVNIDLGDETDIHPRDKKPVGERAAYAALALLYGEDGVTRGPVLADYHIVTDKVILRFEHTGSGLVFRNGADGFEIADASGRYYPAQAALKGDTVELWHDQVTSPSGARYAYGAFPQVTLYNVEGFPAEAFVIDGD